jgi:hypothetical protein
MGMSPVVCVSVHSPTCHQVGRSRLVPPAAGDRAAGSNNQRGSEQSSGSSQRAESAYVAPGSAPQYADEAANQWVPRVQQGNSRQGGHHPMGPQSVYGGQTVQQARPNGNQPSSSRQQGPMQQAGNGTLSPHLLELISNLNGQGGLQSSAVMSQLEALLATQQRPPAAAGLTQTPTGQWGTGMIDGQQQQQQQQQDAHQRGSQYASAGGLDLLSDAAAEQRSQPVWLLPNSPGAGPDSTDEPYAQHEGSQAHTCHMYQQQPAHMQTAPPALAGAAAALVGGRRVRMRCCVVRPVMPPSLQMHSWRTPRPFLALGTQM